MFLMLAGGTLAFNSIAKALPQDQFWALLAHHQTHVEWIGASLHDLIQPSFSFIVGVALPFSIAARMAKGQTMGKLTLHAAWRSVLLIALGLFLRSVGKPQTLFSFTDTLIQIGLGYTFLFVLGFRSVRAQCITLAVILFGDWLAFVLYPAPGPEFDFAKVGVSQEWFSQHGLHGLAAHWNKNSNLAWRVDVWLLNLFPQQARFEYNPGSTSTINFIPTLATMILGLLTGELLRSQKRPALKFAWLLLGGMLSLGLGWGLGELGWCPIVKRLWTPSWVLFSGGWCLLLMALFYLILDIWKLRAWAFPLTVIGMNSIAAYCFSGLFGPFIRASFLTHLGKGPFAAFGPAYETFLLGAATFLTYWLILFWMYRRKIFLRI